MKYRLSFLLALTSSLSSFVESQTPSSKFNATFTWIAGSNMTGAPTIYGTPGLASFSADPGGRYGACSAIAYSGPDTLYVYGGILSSTGPTVGDFWALDISSAWWTTIHKTMAQSVGMQGVSSSATFPGSKYFHACALASFNNLFYLFGGSNSGNFENIMWQYNFTLVQWAFLKGSTPSSYATLGSSIGIGKESSSNLPAGRFTHTMNVMPSFKSMLIFDGYTAYSTSSGYLNDLWRYNITSSNWCLLSGSIITVNPPAVYVTAGVASQSNVPAGVNGHAADNLFGSNQTYFFGGSTINGVINELWTFDHMSNLWSYLSVASSSGNYSGPQYPGARLSHSFAAMPNTPLFIMMSGYGYGNLGYIPTLSDVWIFNSSSLAWYWIRGEENANSTGNFGVKDVTTTSSLPPRRSSSAGSFSRAGKLIVFGGTNSFASLNDVWYINITNKVLPISSPVFASSLPSTSLASISITKSITTLQSSAFLTTMNNSTALNLSFTSLQQSTSSTQEPSGSTVSLYTNTSASALSTDEFVSTFLSSSTLSTLIIRSDSQSTTTIMEPSPTASPNPGDSGKSQIQTTSILYVILIVALMFTILAACSVGIFCYTRSSRRKNNHATINSPSIMDDNETASTYSEMLTATTFANRQMAEASESKNGTIGTSMGTTYVANAATVFQTDVVEMSFPVFLEIVETKDYEVTKSIGQGGFGSIWAGTLLSPQLVSLHGTAECVVKRINFNTAENSPGRPDEVRGFQQEVSMMFFFKNNQHFAKLFGFSVEPVAIIMKFYPLGTLKDLVFDQRNRPSLSGIEYTTTLITSLSHNIASGLAAMHTAGFGHHDIKPANILLDSCANNQLCAVLTDLGISRIVTEKILQDVTVMSTAYGHSRRQERLLRADCFSFAIVLFEMMTRQPSWIESTDVIVGRVLKGQRPEWPQHTLRLCAKDPDAEILKSVVEMCWVQDPLGRMTMDSTTAVLRK